MTTLFPQIKRVSEDETSKIIKNVLFSDQDEFKLDKIFEEFTHLTKETITSSDVEVDDDDDDDDIDEDEDENINDQKFAFQVEKDKPLKSQLMNSKSRGKSAGIEENGAASDEDDDEDNDAEDDDDNDGTDDDGDDSSDEDGDGQDDDDDSGSSDDSDSSDSDEDIDTNKVPKLSSSPPPPPQQASREPTSWNLDQFIKSIPVTTNNSKQPPQTKQQNGTSSQNTNHQQQHHHNNHSNGINNINHNNNNNNSHKHQHHIPAKQVKKEPTVVEVKPEPMVISSPDEEPIRSVEPVPSPVPSIKKQPPSAASTTSSSSITSQPVKTPQSIGSNSQPISNKYEHAFKSSQQSSQQLQQPLHPSKSSNPQLHQTNTSLQSQTTHQNNSSGSGSSSTTTTTTINSNSNNINSSNNTNNNNHLQIQNNHKPSGSCIVQIDLSKLKRIPSTKAPTPTTLAYSNSILTGRALKHEADAEKDKTKQAIKYLESAMYFVLHGNEQEIANSNTSYYVGTVSLFKHVIKISAPDNANPDNMTNLKINALAQKCLSLLHYRLYKVQEQSLAETAKTIHQYTQNSPIQQMDGLLIGIRPQLLSAYKKQLAIYNELRSAHDKWHNVEYLCDSHPALRIFFSTIESNCGPLTMITSFSKLMDHVKCGLKLLRTN